MARRRKKRTKKKKEKLDDPVAPAADDRASPWISQVVLLVGFVGLAIVAIVTVLVPSLRDDSGSEEARRRRSGVAQVANQQGGASQGVSNALTQPSAPGAGRAPSAPGPAPSGSAPSGAAPSGAAPSPAPSAPAPSAPAPCAPGGSAPSAPVPGQPVPIPTP